jgi:uncharacterized protein (DUF983 family)
MSPDYNGVGEPSMNGAERKSGNSFGFVVLALFAVFMVLKLTHTVDWSWWWVCAPIWIPFALAFVIAALGQGEKR